MPMLSVRIDADVMDAIDKQAADLGVSRSIWVREALAVIAQPPGQAHPPRALSLQKVLPTTNGQPDCVHPPTARLDLPFSVQCSLCGVIVRRK